MSSAPRPPCPDALSLRWLFQPIVDLLSGEVLGYELLTRTAAGTSPFAEALPPALRHPLERECLRGALLRLRALEATLPPGRFFLNASPEAVCAPDFLPLLLEADLGPALLRRVVLELTERDEVAAPERLREQLQQLAERGVRTALDDFGAGHSGLLTLVHATPGYLKLDMALIRALHRHPYRQQLVRALVAFATSVEAVLIAEGVESWEELEALAALGVRYAQGYLLAHPQPLPSCPCPTFEGGRRRLLARLTSLEAGAEGAVGRLALRGAAVELGGLPRGEALDPRHPPGLDHLVLLREGRPCALVPCAAGETLPPGRPPVELQEQRAKHRLLLVPQTAPVEQVVRLAMERPHEDRYDPVVVVDAEGRLVGTVTIKQLLAQAMSRGAAPDLPAPSTPAPTAAGRVRLDP